MPNCETCTEKCPKAERAHDAAIGRMYAMQELVRMVKEKEALPVTNTSRPTAMSDEELAEWIKHITPACPTGVDDNDDYNCAARNDCKRCWLGWLRSPLEDNE